MRALGISGAQRAPTLPDVPAIQELGYKEMDVTGHFGLWCPAAAPRERVALIHREAVKGNSAISGALRYCTCRAVPEVYARVRSST